MPVPPPDDSSGSQPRTASQGSHCSRQGVRVGSHKPLHSLEVRPAPFLRLADPVEGMLKTRTETGIDPFINMPRCASRSTTSTARSGDTDSRHAQYPSSATSEIAGSDRSQSLRANTTYLAPPYEDEGRPLSPTACGARPPRAITQRPRSPYPYTTRLKRPGVRPSSPALTEDGHVDYSRRKEIDMACDDRTPYRAYGPSHRQARDAYPLPPTGGSIYYDYTEQFDAPDPPREPAPRETFFTPIGRSPHRSPGSRDATPPADGFRTNPDLEEEPGYRRVRPGFVPRNEVGDAFDGAQRHLRQANTRPLEKRGQHRAQRGSPLFAMSRIEADDGSERGQPGPHRTNFRPTENPAHKWVQPSSRRLVTLEIGPDDVPVAEARVHAPDPSRGHDISPPESPAYPKGRKEKGKEKFTARDGLEPGAPVSAGGSDFPTIICPKPISPVRQSELRHSIPHMMKGLAGPPDGPGDLERIGTPGSDAGFGSSNPSPAPPQADGASDGQPAAPSRRAIAGDSEPPRKGKAKRGPKHKSSFAKKPTQANAAGRKTLAETGQETQDSSPSKSRLGFKRSRRLKKSSETPSQSSDGTIRQQPLLRQSTPLSELGARYRAGASPTTHGEISKSGRRADPRSTDTDGDRGRTDSGRDLEGGPGLEDVIETSLLEDQTAQQQGPAMPRAADAPPPGSRRGLKKRLSHWKMRDGHNCDKPKASGRHVKSTGARPKAPVATVPGDSVQRGGGDGGDGGGAPATGRLPGEAAAEGEDEGEEGDQAGTAPDGGNFGNRLMRWAKRMVGRPAA